MALHQVVIKSADGSTVDVDSLEIPEGLKNLLKVIDADGGGVVDDTNVRDAMKMFTTMKALKGPTIPSPEILPSTTPPPTPSPPF